MIEVRKQGAAARLAVLIRCADTGGAGRVGRMRWLFDVTLLSWSLPVYETREEVLAG